MSYQPTSPVPPWENISDGLADVTPWGKHPGTGLSPLSSCLCLPLGENWWVEVFGVHFTHPSPYSYSARYSSHYPKVLASPSAEPHRAQPFCLPATRLGHGAISSHSPWWRMTQDSSVQILLWRAETCPHHMSPHTVRPQMSVGAMCSSREPILQPAAGF